MGGGVPLEKLRPKWADATSTSLVEVMKEKTTIVLHFVGADDAKPENAIFSAGLYDRSKDKTAFLHVKQNASPQEATDRDPSLPPIAQPAAKPVVPTPSSKMVPASKFAQDDLWAAYGVDKKTGGGTMIVTDQFGNEFKRYAAAPKYKDLERMIDSVPNLVAEKTKKLLGEFEKAKAYNEKGTLDKALKSLMTVFKSGFVAQNPMKDAEELYETIVDAGREKLDIAVLHDDAKAISGLSKIYKGTDLETEIAKAEQEVAAAIAARKGEVTARK
jgi:hypothetical protein